MSQAAEPSILRRRFLSIATATYDDPSWPPLPQVTGEVQVLRDWLCDTALADRSFSPWHSELADNPTIDDIRKALENPPPAERLREADAAVLYVTGHGDVAEGSHWVVLRQTEEDRITATALRTSDLFGWLLATRVRHLLLIYDLCYSGAVGKDVVRFDRSPPPGWIGITSAGAREKATTGALTSAVRAFLDELGRPEGQKYGSPTDPYLRIEDLLRVLQRELSRLDPPQTLTLLNTQLPSLDLCSPCLPNPHYQSGAAARVTVELARRDLALPQSDLLAHWSPKARGVPANADPGWLFTGRRELMTRLIEFASGPPGALVVTGGAGCGKSAVLARLVTLSDPAFRKEHKGEVAEIPGELLPPPGAVKLAVVATGKSAENILMQLCGAVGAAPMTGRAPAAGTPVAAGPHVPGPDGRPGTALGSAGAVTEAWLNGWWAWLRRQPGPVTVVVDALDEAVDPFLVLTSVLQSLDLPEPEPHRLRLLLAVRSPGASGPGTQGPRADGSTPQAHPHLADLARQRLAGELIRADTDPYWNDADLADYAEEILRTADRSPYAGPQQVTVRRRLSAVIAKSVGRSFLIARIVAGSLAARPYVQDPDEPGFHAMLAQGVAGVLRDDLRRSLLSPADRRRAVDLLRATAYAFGRGVPWLDIWPAMAIAIRADGTTYDDRDIAWLLDSRLSGYLVTDQEDGVTVYRPFHDALRDALRGGWDALLAEEPK